jgi:hypothetical protein
MATGANADGDFWRWAIRGKFNHGGGMGLGRSVVMSDHFLATKFGSGYREFDSNILPSSNRCRLRKGDSKSRWRLAETEGLT